MLKFTKITQENPQKKSKKIRLENFNEIYTNFAKKKAEEQSSRCSQCGVPFCQVHCPLHNNIPDWLQLTAENRLEEAYQISVTSIINLRNIIDYLESSSDSILEEHLETIIAYHKEYGV